MRQQILELQKTIRELKLEKIKKESILKSEQPAISKFQFNSENAKIETLFLKKPRITEVEKAHTLEVGSRRYDYSSNGDKNNPLQRIDSSELPVPKK